MTWGMLVDTRRAIVTFFLVMFFIVLGLFMCMLLLVSSNVLAETSAVGRPAVTIEFS